MFLSVLVLNKGTGFQTGFHSILARQRVDDYVEFVAKFILLIHTYFLATWL